MSCDLLVNGTAALRSSRGVARFYSNVMHHLAWTGRIELLAQTAGRLDRLRELAMRGRADALLWSPSHRGPLDAHHHVVSVHDCINVEYTYRNDWRLPAFRRLFEVVLGHAEAIVALSHATRESILRNYRVAPEKIVVIPAGFDAVGPVDARPPERGGPPFVLMVTNGLPHKNTAGIVAAFLAGRARAEGVVLRIVGSLDAVAAELLRAARESFELYARIDDQTLAAWYRDCRFLLAPSFEEGYDLPVAEALVAGANVLCSDIAAHREFFSGYVEFFDPRDGDSMTSAIDLGLARAGRWHEPPRNPRGYPDVAADYRRLFERVCAGIAAR